MNGEEKKRVSWAMVPHAFYPALREAEAGGSLEFEASQIYRVSSRTEIHRETLPQKVGGGRRRWLRLRLVLGRLGTVGT